jgi:hypothetical protein
LSSKPDSAIGGFGDIPLARLLHQGSRMMARGLVLRVVAVLVLRVVAVLVLRVVAGLGGWTPRWSDENNWGQRHTPWHQFFLLSEAQVRAFATKPVAGQAKLRIQNVAPNKYRVRYLKQH